MKRQILVLILIVMLVLLPVTHVMATSEIQEDCQKLVSEADLKTYIKNHVSTGHKEHSVIIDVVRNDFDPKTGCSDSNHQHKQLMQTIVVKDICRMTYKCLDENGDRWEVKIEGKVGQENGVYYDDKTLSENAVISPCNVYGCTYTYDLKTINNEDLVRLFNLIISVDQYLDDATGSEVLKGLALNFAEGSTGIAGTLLTIAETGGKIPYIGQVILVATGAGFAIYSLYSVVDTLHKIDMLKAQCVDTAKAMCC